MAASPERPGDVVALDDALSALAAIDPRKAKIIEMRYFGGVTIEETSHASEFLPQPWPGTRR